MKTLPAAAALLFVLAGCSREEPHPAQLGAAGALLRPGPPLAPGTPAAPAVPANERDYEDVAPPSRDSIAFPADRFGTLVEPVVIVNACEGEDCHTSFVARICKPTDLRASRSDDSPVSGHLERGDSARVTREDLLVRPGLVVVRRDTLGFVAGDSLLLLRYYELGGWQWWRRGEVWSGTEFWRGPAGRRGFGGVAGQDTTGAAAIAIRHHDAETWYHVVARTGAEGWWRQGTAGFVGDAFSMDHWGETCDGYKP